MSPLDQLLYWSFRRVLLVTAEPDTLSAALSSEVYFGIKANIFEPLHAFHFKLANFDQA
jgi:hypothetical protein